MTEVHQQALATTDLAPRHIVDVLIEERAEHLMSRPLVWRFVQTCIYPLLGYKQAIAMVDEVQDMSGYQIFEHVSQVLQLSVGVRGLDNLPATGRAIVTPNHPGGIADGIAVFDGLRSVRNDLIFFANRDAVRAAPALTDLIIPVEWVEDRRDHTRSKETVRAMIKAFKQERLVVIFPSGRLAQPTLSGLKERPWLTTAVSLAQKYDCPIVPMNMIGSNSLLYYFFWYLNTELKDMTLFRELLKKAGTSYQLTIAPPFFPEGDPEQVTDALRSFVTSDLRQAPQPFAHSAR